MAAWINLVSMFLVFCLIIWVVDQYQGGLGLPVQENVDQLADLLKSNILMVCIEMSSYDFLHFAFLSFIIEFFKFISAGSTNGSQWSITFQSRGSKYATSARHAKREKRLKSLKLSVPLETRPRKNPVLLFTIYQVDFKPGPHSVQ